jgi:hypothetical protein
MIKQNSHFISLLTGVFFVVFGAFYEEPSFSAFFITLGIFMLVINSIRFNNLSSGGEQDEIIKKISKTSLSYSWLLTFVALNLLFWLNSLDIVKVDFPLAFRVILSVMVFSLVFFRLIFNNKGIIHYKK